MKIAHWGIWAPNRSGMHHTVKDIVVAQREAGIECGMIDGVDPKPRTDGKFRSESFQYADTADIYGMHLAIPEPYYSDGTPTIMFLHGHPLYSMQVELYGLEPGNDRPYTTICNYFRRTQPTWFVSFWKEDQSPFWDILDAGRDRVRYIPRGIHFSDQFVPEGPARSLEGSPSIVIADQFRVFKDVLPCLYGAMLYCRYNPTAKVHLFGLPPKRSRERECLDMWLLSTGMHGSIANMEEVVPYIDEVYRGGDILVSNVTCESRVIVEAGACGMKTVAPWEGATSYVAKPWRPDHFAAGIHEAYHTSVSREGIAANTRSLYGMEATVAGLKALYEEIIS